MPYAFLLSVFWIGFILDFPPGLLNTFPRYLCDLSCAVDKKNYEKREKGASRGHCNWNPKKKVCKGRDKQGGVWAD